MAQHKRVDREKTKEPEEESRHKKRTTQPFDQFKAPDEGITPGIEPLVKPSMDKHASLLAGAHSDEHLANLVIQLQQTYGNSYVQRLLNSRGIEFSIQDNDIPIHPRSKISLRGQTQQPCRICPAEP